MNRQPELYRTPKKPGYLGGYNWRATCFGLLLLLVVNFAATQFIAARFEYQPALGRPLLRSKSRRRHLRTLRLGHLGMAQLHVAGPARSQASL